MAFGEACITFNNMLTFYGEELLDCRPVTQARVVPLFGFS